MTTSHIDILQKCIERNPSCDFRNCTIDELEALYKLLSLKLDNIKRIKNKQHYLRLSDQLCDDPDTELKGFKTIIYADSIEKLKNDILTILEDRQN